MSTNQIEAKLKQVKPLIAEKFHVSKIGYFGSYANGRANEDSDLDLLVEFSQPVGWSFFTLESYLEKALGLRIDIVTKAALKRQIKESILDQVIYV